MKPSLKRIILGILIVLTLGVVYATATHRWFGLSGKSVAASQSAIGERKPLYWFDAMNPQHHYNKPGKAPDGMDLVPQYAEDSASQSAATTSAVEPSGERKILFWYDPMHPAYESYKPRVAPACGMQLVPNDSDDDMPN